jgi:hypothetical protein
MKDLQVMRLYLHDDNVPPVITANSISVRNEPESLAVFRGHTIGEIVNKSKGWLNFDLDRALSIGTATIRNIILQEFLRVKEMQAWEGHEELVRVVMASQCIYLSFDRPPNSKITLTPVEIESWTPIINASQDLFAIGEGRIISGSPHGGTIQFAYSLRD